MARRAAPPVVSTDGRLAWRPDELARITGLSRATVYRLIASGELAASRVGGALIVTADAWQTLVKRTRVPGAVGGGA